ncbi:hypothetical protein HMPREF9419_0137 [Prevotella nigrescens ATCC 33563]|nr:hypothetical protein HMPREF9419_0137 [Prevotella nigrescens ATCC 33563]
MLFYSLLSLISGTKLIKVLLLSNDKVQFYKNKVVPTIIL